MSFQSQPDVRRRVDLSGVPSIYDQWQSVQEEVQEWDSAAYLWDININIKNHGQSSLDQYPITTYTFRRKNDKYNWLLVRCNTRYCSGREKTMSRATSQCPPLQMNDIKVHSQEAFYIGLENGGLDYIFEENSGASAKLFNQCDSQKTIWSVYFSDLAVLESMTILIDAKTGEIIEIR
jgi:hypothetical protein